LPEIQAPRPATSHKSILSGQLHGKSPFTAVKGFPYLTIGSVGRRDPGDIGDWLYAVDLEVLKNDFPACHSGVFE